MSNRHILYILTSYPNLTTTFVDREVYVMQELGVPLRILAVQKPNTMLSDRQKELLKIVTYLHPLRRASQLTAHLQGLLKHPGKYLSTLAYVLTRPHKSIRGRIKTLNQFHQGICAAYLLRNYQIDHIHVHFINYGILALVLSRILGIPYSVTAHSAGDIFVKPTLLPAKLGNAKFIATCTRYNVDYLKQMGKGVYDDKVKCVYHGLDIQRYRRQQPITDRARPVIVGVGQLKERKGFHVLIDALGVLHQQGIDFECRIIGEGPLRAQLAEQIQRLDLSEKVHLLGVLSHDQVFEQYEQANIFALPAVLASNGDRDGIPNVILEAMAMELPVVSTTHSAIPEVVENGVNGLLVPPNDVPALVEALTRLLQNPQLRADLGCKGRETVAEKFDPVKNAQLLIDEFAA